ncbi:DnaB-like helicase C-terminal domain-containing protein [Rhizobium beringeri]
MERLAAVDRSCLPDAPAWARPHVATNIRHNIAAAYQGEVQSDGSMKAKNGGVVGFLFARNVVRTARHPHHLRADGSLPSKIRRGDINDADFAKLVACPMMMQKVPLFIDQTGGISIAQLSARARRLKRQRGLTFVVDYIQLMTGSGKSATTRA